MTEETEQKILKASLKIFAEKGYKGATTSAIAEEAGFSEKTLFRKFKIKENLYNKVLITNGEKFVKEFMESVNVDTKFDTPADFLESFIKNLANVMLNNFEFFNLSLNESNKVLEPMMSNAVDFMGIYIEENIPNLDIDYKIFGFTISSFVYSITLERYIGRTYINYEYSIENFIKNTIHCVNQGNSLSK
jgi:TetR/AcrR family transcriptional regulator